jgi:Lipase (class 3)
MSPAVSSLRVWTNSRFYRLFSVTLLIGTCFATMSQHAASAKMVNCPGNAESEGNVTGDFWNAGSEGNVRGDFWKSVRVKARTAAKKAALGASSVYAPLYTAKALLFLGPISETEFRQIPIPLLEDMYLSVQKNSQIYTKISDGHSLSIGDDDLPDCVAQYEEETATLWVVCRGSQTASDILTGTTWLERTAKIGHLNIPIGIVKRCASIIPNLLEHLEVSKFRKNKIQRIVFTGHSLGGAVATSLYLSWHLSELFIAYPSIKTSAISIGAPLLISNPPTGFYTTSTDTHSKGVLLAKNVHNIVTQLDIVPRILGKHSLPNFIYRTYFGNFFKLLLLSTIQRSTYRPYGNFYSLRLPISEGIKKISKFVKRKMHKPVKDSFLISLVSDPEKNLLNIFPNKAADILYGIHQDHSLKGSRIALRMALKQAIEYQNM